MAKYLDMTGLSYLWEQIKSKLSTKVDKEEGKQLSTNDYTTTEKNKLAEIEDGANKYIHPTSGVTASSYTKVTVDVNGHVTAGGNPTTLSGYGITDAASKTHTHVNADITSLDASKLTGTIDIERLPQGALERLIVVADDTARLALTTSSIQKGDTVKVTSTGLMYFVVDDTKLSSESGYEQYTAGTATAVAWSGITGKPSTYTPASHTHTKSEISDFPSSLKNPTALSLVVNGTTTSYDGSAAKSITISESTLGITAVTNAEIDTIVAQ
jgi:phage-related tail fiber protein